MRMNVSMAVEPRDLWLGVYWDAGCEVAGLHPDETVYGSGCGVVPALRSIYPDAEIWRVVKVFVCVIPCLPIRLTFRWPVR